MSDNLDGAQLAGLIKRVFEPGPDDQSVVVMVDLPDEATPDSPSWQQRRLMAAQWAERLAAIQDETGLRAHLYLYRNVRANNADLPEHAYRHRGGALPATADALDSDHAEPFAQVLQTNRLVLAPTEFSATAPLKLTAKQHGFRAATMPGFLPSMLPALKLDYGEINRRVLLLKELLDRSVSAELAFVVAGGTTHRLTLDLRYRLAHASGGLLPKPGTAGNLPSGETYIVPYEGEREGEPSRSAGHLPVQFGDEVVVYRVENNRAVAVDGNGEIAQREAAKLAQEPAYGNLAELLADIDNTSDCWVEALVLVNPDQAANDYYVCLSREAAAAPPAAIEAEVPVLSKTTIVADSHYVVPIKPPCYFPKGTGIRAAVAEGTGAKAISAWAIISRGR